MSEIVLATLNAKYQHASFGLRYLMANLKELARRAVILEFDIGHTPVEIVEKIAASRPRIVGLGVYIWNASQSAEVVSVLKRVCPDVIVILGGPEVSHEIDAQEITRRADYVIAGEADIAFRELCARLLAGERPVERVVHAAPPEPGDLLLPYHLYTDVDAAHRVIYIEASRGCPFTCEFCLSSLDIPVRQFPVERLLCELEKLMQRGVRQFKFVDRTFNLNLKTSGAILQFFLERCRPGLFAHFEMIPDRLPNGLRDIIKKFPAGALQFEVGIQTFNPEVSRRISRRQDYEKLEENLRFLRAETGVHVHADLIAGLPGEPIESFAAGFDRLVALAPQEIQVGMLKRLRGTPIVRHDAEWGMVYRAEPPYEVLKTKVIDFESMQRLKRFSRYWDLVSNSGNFVNTAPLMWRSSGAPFDAFMSFSDWLYRASGGRRHGIALRDLARFIGRFLCDELGISPDEAAAALRADFARGGREAPALGDAREPALPPAAHHGLPRRQARHLST
jgi:radical SAM superfamily enzyme YgiQ (UPF0313 family)